VQLAFLPVSDVVPSFIELLDLIPSGLGFDDFLNYFMTTLVQLQELNLPAFFVNPGTSSSGLRRTTTQRPTITIQKVCSHGGSLSSYYLELPSSCIRGTVHDG